MAERIVERRALQRQILNLPENPLSNLKLSDEVCRQLWRSSQKDALIQSGLKSPEAEAYAKLFASVVKQLIAKSSNGKVEIPKAFLNSLVHGKTLVQIKEGFVTPFIRFIVERDLAEELRKNRIEPDNLSFQVRAATAIPNTIRSLNEFYRTQVRDPILSEIHRAAAPEAFGSLGTFGLKLRAFAAAVEILAPTEMIPVDATSSNSTVIAMGPVAKLANLRRVPKTVLELRDDFLAKVPYARASVDPKTDVNILDSVFKDPSRAKYTPAIVVSDPALIAKTPMSAQEELRKAYSQLRENNYLTSVKLLDAPLPQFANSSPLALRDSLSESLKEALKTLSISPSSIPESSLIFGGEYMRRFSQALLKRAEKTSRMEIKFALDRADDLNRAHLDNSIILARAVTALEVEGIPLSFGTVFFRKFPSELKHLVNDRVYANAIANPAILAPRGSLVIISGAKETGGWGMFARASRLESEILSPLHAVYSNDWIEPLYFKTLSMKDKLKDVVWTSFRFSVSRY